MQPIFQPLEELLARLLEFLPKLISGIVLFILVLYASAWIARAVERGLRKRSADPEAIILIKQLTRWGLLILGTIAAIEQVDGNITSLLAGLGIAGFTIGFALQDIAKNFVSGLLLLLQQPLELGDAVEVCGYSGTVVTISLRTTEIRTWDGRFVEIPNADVYINPIVNFSRGANRRIELTVGVGYSSDLDHVSHTALHAIRKIDNILLDPEPKAVFTTFGNSAIDLTLYYWTKTSVLDPLAAKDAGIKAVKLAFEREQIEIPFPIREMISRTE
jgi:small conductance mechanosensitive channel